MLIVVSLCPLCEMRVKRCSINTSMAHRSDVDRASESLINFSIMQIIHILYVLILYGWHIRINVIFYHAPTVIRGYLSQKIFACGALHPWPLRRGLGGLYKWGSICTA